MAKATNKAGSSNIWLGSKQNTRQTILYIPADITAGSGSTDKPGLIFLESIASAGGTANLGGLYLWADDNDAFHVSNTYPLDQNAAGSIIAAASTDATLLSIADLGTGADKMLYTDGVDSWAELAVTSYGRSILDDVDEATLHATINLEIGNDVQAYDAGLTNLAAVAMVADRMYYTSGDNVHVATPITATGRSILDDASTGAVLTTIGAAAIGSNADITAMSGLTGDIADPVNIAMTGNISGVVNISSMTGSIATPTTITASSHITTAGNIIIDSNSSKLQMGDTPASNSAIYYDGTSLQFEDDDGGVTYTLKELATGTTLNPTVNGNLTIAAGDFDWTKSANTAATWTLANTTTDCIDFVLAGLTSGSAIHIVADAVTSGKVLHIQSDHDTAAAAHIYLDWDEGNGDGDGRYLVCYDGSGDVLTVKQNGALAIAGSAEGTDAITITDGDITLTDGDLQVVAGYVQADSTDDDTSHFKKNNDGASAVVLEVENTHGTGTGYAQTIVQAASSGASGGLSISNKGSSPILYLAAGGSRTGGSSYGIHIPVANQVAERLVFIDGAYVGTDNQGAIEVATTAASAAGANLLRLTNTGGDSAQNSYIAEIVNTGNYQTGATLGTCLRIDDLPDGGGHSAKSWAVCIDAHGTNTEALRIERGTCLFDEAIELTGGFDSDADSTLDGKLTITAADSPGVDALVIDQNDTDASKDGIQITNASAGYALKMTTEKTDGKGAHFISVASQTTSNVSIDGATGAWIGGADNVGMVQITHATTALDHVGGTLLRVSSSAQQKSGAEGTLARFECTGGAQADATAVEIAAVDSTERALHVLSGYSTFVHKATFTAGAQSSAVTVVPDGTGVLIPAGTSFVNVDCSNADHRLMLPATTLGNIIVMQSDSALDFELTGADNATYINGVLCDGSPTKEMIVPDDETLIAICYENKKWVTFSITDAGVVTDGATPDAA